MSKTTVSKTSSRWTVIRRDGYITDPAAPGAVPQDPPAADPKATPSTPAEPESWEKFLDAQPDPIKKLYTDHHTGLNNSNKAIRGERDALEMKVKELLPKAEKGSEFETQLQNTLKELEGQKKKSSFYESAIKPEIGCHNVEVAFLLANSKDLFKKDGSPDWDEIKKVFPEGFNQPAAPAAPVPTISPTAPNSGPALTKEGIEKMTPEEINKHWKDGSIAEFLKNNPK